MKRLDLSKYDGHSPGPWVDDSTVNALRCDSRPNYYDCLCGGEHEYVGDILKRGGEYPAIITCDGGYYGPHGADRRLIVDAPILLEALKEAYAEIDRLNSL